jgi:hypothetical protein
METMAYYAVIIFLSAFLVFQVQPMLAKYILPWFGGTPAVWSSVQMFFQVALTGGYAYASWLTRPGKYRQWIHISLLAISAVLLFSFGWIWKSPITPDASWKPESGAPPIWEIIKLLTVSVGLPYFLLSTNSPLVQTWFQRAFPGKTAYRLYALSNIGSMLGLISYPLLVEPFFTLKWQGWIWTALYLLFAGLALWGVIRSRRLPVLAAGSSAGLDVSERQARPRRIDILLWLGLGATASTLLLATTSHITQEVAVIPFLWVLPLAIYLLSFIVAFSGERWYSRQYFLPAFFVSTLLAGWALGRSEDLAIGLQIGIYSLTLFCACMICHGELYRLRPSPGYLTIFYLYVSIGGALGGIFITFLAPLLFRGYWELPLGIAFCWILFLVVVIRNNEKTSRGLFIVNQVLMLSALIFAGIRALQFIRSDLQGSLLLERNFYGVVRVKLIEGDEESQPRFALVHGITIHGFQYQDDPARDIPTAYFGETGGGGLVLRNHPRSGYGMRVGILGLGIGTLASYGQTGDTYRFYEINPLVIQIAEGQGGFFSYLADSQAEIEIVAGDARLSLEEESTSGGSQEYDVLILDVFSSDSIPVHLLDREAFELYLTHLSQTGILAVHISNRHLDLIPVVWSLADYFNLARVVISDPGDQEAVFPSLWMLLAVDPGLLMDPDIVYRSEDMAGYEPSIRLWTDDYSNLIQILK